MFPKLHASNLIFTFNQTSTEAKMYAKQMILNSSKRHLNAKPRKKLPLSKLGEHASTKPKMLRPKSNKSVHTILKLERLVDQLEPI